MRQTRILVSLTVAHAVFVISDAPQEYVTVEMYVAVDITRGNYLSQSLW